MRVLALDLGTNMGFAMSGDGGSVLSGVMNYSFDSRFEGGGMRYVRFKKWLNEIRDFDFKMVVFEEVRRHAGTTAAHVYGGFLAVLTEWCEEQAIPYQAVAVGAIKKFATGKGNANKQAMIDAVRSWGFEPVDDNEADAIAILTLTLTDMGEA